MPIVEVDIQVYCETCGAGICHLSTGKRDHRGNTGLHVAPCTACMKNERDAGYEEGYEKAQAKFDVDVED